MYCFSGSQVWKVRYMSHNWLPGTERCEALLCHCDGEDVIWHEKPLVFDMTSDPSESQPLDPSDIQYQKVIEATEKAKLEHENTLKDIPSSWRFHEIVWHPHLQPCCNFPYCSCTDQKYTDL